jgi:hypothetical protein
VYVHTIVAEQKLGRLLLDGEVVHHKDKNRKNNSPENIEIFTSQKEHGERHSGDHPAVSVSLKCGWCGKAFERLRRKVSAGAPVFCSKSCAGRRRYGSPDRPERHGTAVWYTYHRCRCDLCRKAHTERHRKWRRGSP